MYDRTLLAPVAGCGCSLQGPCSPRGLATGTGLPTVNKQVIASESSSKLVANG
jgi:hypothetical protein